MKAVDGGIGVVGAVFRTFSFIQTVLFDTSLLNNTYLYANRFLA